MLRADEIPFEIIFMDMEKQISEFCHVLILCHMEDLNFHLQIFAGVKHLCLLI